MATTTNYGWTTPDDTALVKDGASAIRTLGTSVDTTTKNLNPSTTLGDIEYRSSTANTNTRLGIGTTGQVLSVSGGVPAWATVASGGMTLISTTTLTGASVTLSSIPSTYYNLYLVIRDFLPATDAADLFMRVNADATASRHVSIAPGVGDNNSFDSTRWQIARGQDNAVANSLITITLFDYTNTDTWKTAYCNAINNNYVTTTNFNFVSQMLAYNQNTAVSSLQFLPDSGNFTSGTILLYGVK